MRTAILTLAAATALVAPRTEAAEIVVAGGCFWCVEADFEKVRGVSEVVSGYTGGTTDNPTYDQVTGGDTGHYEAARIEYDADAVNARQLYDLFFRSIDPFDAGGQFCDRGDSYRTAIFVDGPEERQAAEAAKAAAEDALGREVVTPILPLEEFYRAEEYHQDYYKSTKRTLTRFGYIDRADAYERYRDACRRDERVREIWGDDAPFI
jgi:peptide-methionine (S)-S-oxide reductase